MEDVEGKERGLARRGIYTAIGTQQGVLVVQG